MFQHKQNMYMYMQKMRHQRKHNYKTEQIKVTSNIVIRITILTVNGQAETFKLKIFQKLHFLVFNHPFRENCSIQIKLSIGDLKNRI